jgi:hypothetical protein
MPTMPLAPVRFSTITDWPSGFSIAPAMMRATMSGAPPGANGTIRRMAREGYCSAAASEVAAATASTTKARCHPERCGAVTALCLHDRR